jgi:hypothetical protein
MDVENELSPQEIRAFRKIGNEIVSAILCEEFDDAIARIRAAGARLRDVVASSIWVQEQNLLHQAAKSGHVGLVKCILGTGCFDIEGRDNEGTAPLYFAAGAGHLDVVKLLLERGADIEARRSKSGQHGRNAPTALVSAMIYKREEVALYLMDAGAASGPNVTDAGAASGPNVTDAGGRTIFAMTIDGDLAEVFKRLCLRKHFGDDWTGMMATVARSGSEKILDFCLGFPPLAETVSGDKVNPAVSQFWCESARQKILSWRAERDIAGAFGEPLTRETTQRRSHAPSL